MFADHLETWSTVKRQPNEAYIRHIFGERKTGIDEPPFQAERQPRCSEDQGCCSECSQVPPRWRFEPIMQVLLQPCEQIRTDKMANSKIWRNLTMPRVAPRSICEPRRSNQYYVKHIFALSRMSAPVPGDARPQTRLRYVPRGLPL